MPKLFGKFRIVAYMIRVGLAAISEQTAESNSGLVRRTGRGARTTHWQKQARTSNTIIVGLATSPASWPYLEPNSQPLTVGCAYQTDLREFSAAATSRDITDRPNFHQNRRVLWISVVASEIRDTDCHLPQSRAFSLSANFWGRKPPTISRMT